MTVKELIEKLKTMDQDKIVYCICEGDNPLDLGSDIKNIYQINGHNADFVNSVYISYE